VSIEVMEPLTAPLQSCTTITRMRNTVDSPRQKFHKMHCAVVFVRVASVSKAFAAG
jgi:hypothetical protein